MKTIFLILASIVILINITNATSYNILTSGFTYSPNLLTVDVGDVVNISASGNHPLVQVSKATWNAGESTPVAGGWGTKTTTYQFTASVADTIYFVCANHVSMGMKGKIIVRSISLSDSIFQGASSSLQVFPNPASSFVCIDFLNLELVNEGWVKIVNILGEEVFSAAIEQKKLYVDCSNWINKGMYYVYIVNPKFQLTHVQKIILQ